MNHTFVVCAYGESPYLRECLHSLQKQTVRSRIVISTSTPNEAICNTAKEFGLEVRANQGETGIAGDWNFALQQARTPLVTLTHQDDLYLPDYTRKVLQAYKKKRNAIILFTDYRELRELNSVPGKRTRNKEYNGRWQESESRLVQVKRIMLLPLRSPALQDSRWIRRRVLSFGNAICCPSVTYVKKRVPEKPFAGSMKSNIDWQAWEQLSRRKGSFVYVPEKLMLHRIHRGSTTSGLVSDHARMEEDLNVLRRFWPGKMPELVWRLYGSNEKYQ